MEIAKIEGREIVIRIPIATLPLAFSMLDVARNPLDDAEILKVVDPDAFAEEVCELLNEEREDGSTPITDAIDRAMTNTVLYGCAYGVEDATHA